MRRLLAMKPVWALTLYALLDLLGVALGMGVPVFCILLGLPVGWYVARRLATGSTATRSLLRGILSRAAIAVGFTFVLMGVIWAPTMRLLWDPHPDFVNFGIPLILYDPLASFIGWQVLMIIVSPFLQFLMVLFGAQLTLAVGLQTASDQESSLVSGAPRLS